MVEADDAVKHGDVALCSLDWRFYCCVYIYVL